MWEIFLEDTEGPKKAGCKKRTNVSSLCPRCLCSSACFSRRWLLANLLYGSLRFFFFVGAHEQRAVTAWRRREKTLFAVCGRAKILEQRRRAYFWLSGRDGRHRAAHRSRLSRLTSHTHARVPLSTGFRTTRGVLSASVELVFLPCPLTIPVVAMFAFKSPLTCQRSNKSRCCWTGACTIPLIYVTDDVSIFCARDLGLPIC